MSGHRGTFHRLDPELSELKDNKLNIDLGEVQSRKDYFKSITHSKQLKNSKTLLTQKLRTKDLPLKVQNSKESQNLNDSTGDEQPPSFLFGW